MRKGDRFITIDVLLAGVYGDTLKCKSDKVSEIATVQIVPGICACMYICACILRIPQMMPRAALTLAGTCTFT